MVRQALSQAFDSASKGFEHVCATSLATGFSAIGIYFAANYYGQNLIMPFLDVAKLVMPISLGSLILKDMTGSIAETLNPAKLDGPKP